MHKSALLWLLLICLLAGCGDSRSEQGGGNDTQQTIEPALELSIWSDIHLDEPGSVTHRVQTQYADVSFKSRYASHEELATWLDQEQLPDMIYIAGAELPDEVMAKLLHAVERGDANLIPANRAPGGLFYNQDLFDKFGIPYPQDGMNWDEVIPLIRKLTRQEGGRTYYGFAASMRYLSQSNPWSLPLIDRDLRRAVINNDTWKSWLDQMHALFNATDIRLSEREMEQSMRLFVKEKNLAMWAGNDILYSLATGAEGLDWDVVRLPHDADLTWSSERMQGEGVPFWVVSEVGEHMDAAYWVLSYLFSPTAYRYETTYLFSEMIEQIKGKNISALFQNQMGVFNLSPRIADDALEIAAREQFYIKLMQMITNQMDGNTALRETEEIINTQIQAADGS